MMSRSWRSTWNGRLAEERLHRSVQEGDGGRHRRREEVGGCDSWWTTHWVNTEIGGYTKLLATFRHGKGEEYKNKKCIMHSRAQTFSHIIIHHARTTLSMESRSLLLSVLDSCPYRCLFLVVSITSLITFFYSAFQARGR